MRHESDDHAHLFSTNSANYDHFYNSFSWDHLQDAEMLHNSFREFLEVLRPDLIHFHHYSHMGVELISLARSVIPGVRIVMTLHEYMPICANRGAMIKTKNNQLCNRASPLHCHECFPDRSPGEFFLRERFFKSNFRHVDRFIAPSQFLQKRYVEWGLDRERFLQMDNGRPIWPKLERQPRQKGQSFVAAFFGQIVFHKGVDVLLRAAVEYRRQLERRKDDSSNELPEIRFAIHGKWNLEGESVAQDIEKLTDECREVLHLHGSYNADSMRSLLARVDCVVLPSKWWENSPLVIQEAFMAGVPIVCSDIGGMAEKVTDRVNGLHFVAGSHFALLDRLLELASSPELYERLVQGIPEILSDQQMAASMQELYTGLLGSSEAPVNKSETSP